MGDRGKIIVVIAAGLVLAGVWLYNLYPAFRANRDRMEQIKPMLEEAENSDLDYNKVLSGKDEYIGKYVFWCVQNKSKDEVFYEGDMNNRLMISNYDSVPKFCSGKHSNCADMLLNIEDVRKTRSGAGMITAEFIYSRE
jgi:hypothetical protein